MNILIACEFSGVVRDAFSKRGHYAVSCDLLPSERSGMHYRGDVRDILDVGWDMLVAFPPCTYLTAAGAHLWRYRTREIAEAYEFFLTLYNAPIPHVAIENPQGWLNTHFRKPDQTFHPYQFGHPYKKRTCLWLQNLNPLVPTHVIEGVTQSWVSSTNNYRNRFGMGRTIGVTRSPRERSRTFEGVASAMAQQWGDPQGSLYSMSTSKSLVPQQQNQTPTAADLAVWQPGNIREMFERTQALAAKNAVPYAAQGRAFNRDCIGYPFAIVSPFRYATKESEQFGTQACVQCAIRFLDLESGELDEPILAEWTGNGIIPQSKKLTENEIRAGFWTIRRVGKRGTFYLAWFDPSVDHPEEADGQVVNATPPALPMNGSNGSKRGPGRPRKVDHGTLTERTNALAAYAAGSSLKDVTGLWEQKQD